MNPANHPPTPPAAATDAVNEPAAVRRIPLCASADLREAGEAVPFDVIWRGQTCRAFAIRWQGQVHAYLNRCSHIPMEMDILPNRFFDDSGQWLLCATHGAAYRPDTGACAAGPCRGALQRVGVSEQDGVVCWHAESQVQPVEVP